MVRTRGRSLSWPATGFVSFRRCPAPSWTGVEASRSPVRSRVTVLGVTSTTETATIVPSGWNTWVMPTLRPINPMLIASHLDFDVAARREREPHQCVDGLRRRIEDVDEPLVGADLELLPRVLVDERRPEDRELLDPGRQRHGADDVSARALRRLHDLGCRLVEQPVVVGLEADPDPLLRHLVPYCRMVTMAPAPTVRPPSRMAKRWPTSRAIGVISSTDISTLSPGMIISAPSGSPMAPVTSVVRR